MFLKSLVLWLFECWLLRDFFCGLILRDVYLNFGFGGWGGTGDGQKSAGAPFSTQDLSSVEKCLHLCAGCQSSASLAASIC